MTWPATPVTVRVPATSANLGPGFDSFGLALSLHDTVRARATRAGLDLRVTGEGAQTASAGERHLVVRAMRSAFDVIGTQPGGIELLCGNATPHGFGLGSSAAAIVAGVLAARSLAGPDGIAALPARAILSLATELEGHPDNVAACLSGGLTIAWRPAAGQARDPAMGSGGIPRGQQSGPAAGTVLAARLEPLPELAAVVCLPQQPLATQTARAVLPAAVPHAQAAANSARAALLVAALTRQPELLLAGTEDFLHQDYRAQAMPATAKLVSRLRAAGLAAVVSGAGPAVLVLATAEVAAPVAELAGPSWRVQRLEVDRTGAEVLTAPGQKS